MTRLTKEDVAQVQELLRGGETTETIAEQFGVSQRCIQKYRTAIRDELLSAKKRPRCVVKCKGCPLIFISQSRGRMFHDDECKVLFFQREQQFRLDEFRWIVGTDTPENIARRLGYSSPKNLARFLFRSGEMQWARKFEHVALPQERVRAA